MKCDRCGGESTEYRRTCASCGYPLTGSCAACGFRNRLDARFCGGCGLHLGDVGPPFLEDDPTDDAPSGQRNGAIEGGRVEGERKWVTVLFADIKGSLALMDQIDAEAACAVLDGSIEIMVRAIRRYEGTVNRVLGDGIMAVFGAPRAQEDHAVRGCHAALAIQTELERHRVEVRSRYGVELEIRIGLSSGEVMVRAVRGKVAIPYDVIGTTAHLASRMEQLAPPGAVWLTEGAARLAGDFVDLRPIGPVPVKGLTRPIEVFELDRACPSRRSFDVALARGLGRFVGRHREMTELQMAFAQATAGHGQLVALVGDPGIGKSRLCHEFGQSVRRHGAMVLSGTSVGYGAVAPWQRFAGLLRALFRIDADDGPAQVGAKVSAGLVAIGRDLSAHETALRACLDVPPEDDPDWRALEPKTRGERIRRALFALLERLCQDRPVVLVLEDLHDSDAQTIELLDLFCTQLATRGILFLVTYRAHFRRRWPSQAPIRQIELGPLAADAAREMLDGILGCDQALGSIKAHLASSAEGNPFFLEESVRQLVDSGVLADAPGAYRLAGPVPDLVIPPTVQATIEARIDRLAFEDKRLLRAAAVIGEQWDATLLGAVAETDPDDLDDGLARLRALEFLDLVERSSRAIHRFRHGLVRETAYRTLPSWQRLAVHRRIVVALARADGELPTERLAALADHALKGELWFEAYGYSMDLAQRAMSQSASRDALAACGHAETALTRLADEDEAVRARIDLRFVQIDAHFACGEHERVAEQIEEAYALAERLGDELRLLRASSLRAFRSWFRGQMDDAVAAGREARSIALRLGDFDLCVNTAFRCGVYLLARGDYRAAVEPFEWIIDSVPPERRNRRFGLGGIAEASARAALARTLAELLEFARAEMLATEAMALAERYAHPFSVVYVAQEIGILYLRTGDFAKAVEVLSRGYEVALAIPPNLLRPATASELGAALVETGRITEGLALLTEALESARSLQLVPQYGQQLGYLARGQLLAGNWDEANALAQEALGHARRYGERGDEAWIRYLMAQITEQRRRDRARRQFADVRRLAQERGLSTLEACCRQHLRRPGLEIADEPPLAASKAGWSTIASIR